MKVRYIKGCVLAITIGLGSVAHSAPSNFNNTQVTQFRSTSDSASGSDNCPGNICTFWFAESFDDIASGVRQGRVLVQIFDNVTGTFSAIDCAGPAYANSVLVNQGVGTWTVSAVADPLSPACPFVVGLTQSISINLVGQADGNLHISFTGVSKDQIFGTTFRGNGQLDRFSQTFTGSVGANFGPFSGNAEAQRTTQRRQVK